MDKDTLFMERAIRLAEKARGCTSPNPLVGAVLAKNGRIIGEGYHERCGERHAEIAAIEKAVEDVEGSELYCNLEPCCHVTPEKRTPPCVKRIIRERIRRVVISTVDPNPHVRGRGTEELRRRGIEVETGVLAHRAAILNEVYFKFIQKGQPFIHLKVAQSLDGRIATSIGDSKWISDEKARRLVHQMRHSHDAVLIGANTVRIDNPSLTVRLYKGIPHVKQPLRVILDGSLSIPAESTVLNDRFREKTIIFTSPDCDMSKKALFQEKKIRVLTVPRTHEGLLDIESILKELAALKVTSLLVEGGARVFTEFIRRKLADKISLFIAPIILGRGIEVVNELNIQKLSQAYRLRHVTIETIDDQVLFQGYPNPEITFGELVEAF